MEENSNLTLDLYLVPCEKTVLLPNHYDVQRTVMHIIAKNIFQMIWLLLYTLFITDLYLMQCPYRLPPTSSSGNLQIM